MLRLRREIGQEDFEHLVGGDVVNGVHDTTVILAHDFVLGLRHYDSLEQGRDTHAMLREGSEDDRPGQTNLRELIRIILAFDTLRTVGNSLGAWTVRSPRLHAPASPDDGQGVTRELHLPSDTPDCLDVTIGELGSQEDGTGEMINHVEEDTVQRVPKANSEQHLVANVESIAVGVAQRWESLAGRDTLLPSFRQGTPSDDIVPGAGVDDDGHRYLYLRPYAN